MSERRVGSESADSYFRRVEELRDRDAGSPYPSVQDLMEKAMKESSRPFKRNTPSSSRPSNLERVVLSEGKTLQILDDSVEPPL